MAKASPSCSLHFAWEQSPGAQRPSSAGLGVQASTPSPPGDSNPDENFEVGGDPFTSFLFVLGGALSAGVAQSLELIHA
jgi:hypothetical protein